MMHTGPPFIFFKVTTGRTSEQTKCTLVHMPSGPQNMEIEKYRNIPGPTSNCKVNKYDAIIEAKNIFDQSL